MRANLRLVNNTYTEKQTGSPLAMLRALSATNRIPELEAKLATMSKAEREAKIPDYEGDK